MRPIAMRDLLTTAAASSGTSLLTPGDQTGALPRSPAQEGLWFKQQLAPLSCRARKGVAEQERLTDDMQSILSEHMQ